MPNFGNPLRHFEGRRNPCSNGNCTCRGETSSKHTGAIALELPKFPMLARLQAFRVWLKNKQEASRRFWSMLPLTRVPFWYRFFEPRPFNLHVLWAHASSASSPGAGEAAGEASPGEAGEAAGGAAVPASAAGGAVGRGEATRWAAGVRDEPTCKAPRGRPSRADR